MARKRSKTDKADLWDYYCDIYSRDDENRNYNLLMPDYVIEHEFASHLKFSNKNGRRIKYNFAFDIAYLDARVAVEVDGGIHNGKNRGRHIRKDGFEKDLMKFNLARSMGWVVMRYSVQMLNRNPYACIEQALDIVNYRMSNSGIIYKRDPLITEKI